MEKLAEWCRQFSPIVGIEEAPAPESLFLDISGLAHLFGGERPLAEQVLRGLRKCGLEARVAIADTLGGAWAVVHFVGVPALAGEWNKNVGCDKIALGERRPTTWIGGPAIASRSCPTLLTPTGRKMSPSPAASPMIIPPGQTLPVIGGLPLAALRLPDDVIDLLHSLGIYGIGQLGQLPRADLAARFGPRLAERWDQALGRLAEPIPAQKAPPELEARQALEYPAASREAVEQILKPLIGRLAEMLLRCGRGAIRLDCRLDCRPAGCADFSVGLFQATASAQHLVELASMQLERISLPGPVQAISVMAAGTAPIEERQEELFPDGPSRQQFRLLAALVDRLASRIGYRSVLRPRLVPDAQPESAYRYDPLLEVGNGREGAKIRKERTEKEEDRRGLPPRPLRLMREPVPLAPLAAVSGGPLLRFRFRGREYRVASAWGAERIETGWWRGAMIARDYYRIETLTGQRFWLFRRLDDGRWFLHGAFE